MNRVLVTGGAGFIGSHLVERLLSVGCHVTVFDNFSSGSIENLASVKSHPRIRIVKGDIMDLNTLNEEFRDVDTVFHMAAVVGVKKYVENPLKVLLVNSFGTYNVLEAARKNGVERIIFASTSEIYGKNKNIPLREDSDRVLGPTNIDRWTYSTAKAFDEHLCFSYMKTYGLKITILRYFNIYGPRQESSEYGGVVAIFIKRVLSNKPPIVLGTGKQTRTFTYISDAIDGTMLASEKKEAIGEAFNIGSRNEITILELANLIIELAGKKGVLKPVIEPYEYFYGRSYEDIMRRVPDISKAERILGYKPKVNLRDGLKKTIEWFKKTCKCSAR
ncbi:MAG: NAD-dependent dehydratase [Thermofilum sp. ex4484_79]|nr:MAG: NAD-dependent dehydratase [Thermofilum sp. ex4484_79]